MHTGNNGAAVAAHWVRLTGLAVAHGLEAAIRAAGTEAELARRVGVKAQSVRKWKRVPQDRLIVVEMVTGVARERLRPDLFRGPRPVSPSN
jgi:hypothetical protein